MPTWLIVLLSVAAVISFLLIMRVKVCVGYSDNFDFAAKYLFFTFRIKEPKKGQAKQDKKPPQKFTFQQLRDFLNLFERFWDDAQATLLKVKKKVRIDIIKIDLTVGSDDAAQTAITYGEACAVIYPVESALETLVKVKKRQITINADFNGSVNIGFFCRASISLGNLLTISISSALKILMLLIKNPIRVKQKGVG